MNLVKDLKIASMLALVVYVLMALVNTDACQITSTPHQLTSSLPNVMMHVMIPMTVRMLVIADSVLTILVNTDASLRVHQLNL